MSAPSPKFQKLLAKLRELFELDKADLDFGLYRVLRARREEIDKFLREELLPQVQGELGVVTAEKIKPMEAKVEEEITKVMEYGGKSREEAEASEKVIAAKPLLEQSRNPAALEDEVYSLIASHSALPHIPLPPTDSPTLGALASRSRRFQDPLRAGKARPGRRGRGRPDPHSNPVSPHHSDFRLR